MGWDFSRRDKGSMTDREFFEREYGMVGPDPKHTMLAVATKGLTFYAAVQNHETGEVRALVILMQRHAADFHNFGYKGMDESMGPEAQCPARILDLLTPTDSTYALEWRERCRANLARRADAKLNDGDVVEFAEALNFGAHYETVTRFRYRKEGRTTWWEAMPSTGRGVFRCRIPQWQAREFERVTT